MTLSSEYHWHYLTAQLKFTNFWPKWTKFWFWTGASAGSELVQHANLLLNWLDFTSWSRRSVAVYVSSFPAPLGTTMADDIDWNIVASVRENLLFISPVEESQHAALALVLNDII